MHGHEKSDSAIVDTMGVDSGPRSGRVGLPNHLLLEPNHGRCSSPYCRPDCYHNPAWRNFCFVGTEPFDLAGNLAFTGWRREDVEAFSAGGQCRGTAGALFVI